MTNTKRTLVAFAVCFLSCGLSVAGNDEDPSFQLPTARAVPVVYGGSEALRHALDAGLALPTAFIENRGQWRNGSRFTVRRAGFDASLHPDGIRFELGTRQGERRGFKLSFVGASSTARLVGEKRFAGEHSFFLGNDKNAWRARVPPLPRKPGPPPQHPPQTSGSPT